MNFILMKFKHKEKKLKMKLIGRVILHETINNVFTKAFLFISYRDCIIKGTQKRLCSLYSNTPFNLHLSSINFDTHIHSWSLYNIAPVSYSLFILSFLWTRTFPCSDVEWIWRTARSTSTYLITYKTSWMFPEIIIPSVKLLFIKNDVTMFH